MSGLPIGQPLRRVYSQRVDGKPFVNCLPYSICSVLAYAGYSVPTDYGMTIRTASGVPMAEHRGTSHADMARALARLIPNHPVEFRAVSDAELINLLAGAAKPNRGAVVALSMRMERLPRNLRRHCGYDWAGLHSVGLYGRKRAPDGSWLIYLGDPMGRTYRGYAGEYVALADIQPAMKRTDAGLIRVAYAPRGSAR